MYKRQGNVYGGGSGAGSAVTGNTAVTVNGSGTGTSATDFAAVNVYGGGFINAAGTTTVEGKATVVINGKIKTSVYGGGCQGSSANVTASAVTGSTCLLYTSWHCEKSDRHRRNYRQLLCRRYRRRGRIRHTAQV